MAIGFGMQVLWISLLLLSLRLTWNRAASHYSAVGA
jgi:ABC-type uncharacterized transport system permease subunit